MYYSVDAIESGMVRLVDDAGAARLVPLASLPSGTAQGDVLELRDGVFHPAPDQTRQRRQHAGQLLNRILKQNNPDR